MSEDEDLTNLQRAERDCLLGDRSARMLVVSAIREFRAAAKKLLDARYADGECDAVALSDFKAACEEIEEAHQ